MKSFDTTEFLERGAKLQADIYNFAGRLSTASRAAIEAVNPDLTGTLLGQEWPLTYDLVIERRLAEMVSPTVPRSLGEVAVASEKPTEDPIPTIFLQSRFMNYALEEAYGQDTPRQALAWDVVSWTKKMEQASWPLLLSMDVLERGRVTVSVYEDTDKTRAYFRSRTEGAEPYGSLSERVIVEDPTFATEVRNTIR